MRPEDQEAYALRVFHLFPEPWHQVRVPREAIAIGFVLLLSWRPSLLASTPSTSSTIDPKLHRKWQDNGLSQAHNSHAHIFGKKGGLR